MQKPELAPELDTALDALFTQAQNKFDAGDVDGGLTLADQVWAALPDPKESWDYYPQIVPLVVSEACIEAGKLGEAAEWLDRAYAGYAPQNEASQVLLDFVKARLLFRAGQHDLAFAYFDAIYKSEGQRPFQDLPRDYWDFYDQARRSGGPAGASPEAGSGAPDSTPSAGAAVPPEGSGSGAGGDLPDDLHAEVTRLFEEGSNYEDLNAPKEAVECHRKALLLLPEPRTQWEAATLLYTALGDALLSQTRFPDAEDALNLALKCPGGSENGYVWLRLGDAREGVGRRDGALEAWTSAYMLEGKELFEDEDDAWAALEQAGIPQE